MRISRAFVTQGPVLHGSSVADLRRQLKKFVGTHRFLNFAGRLKEHRKGRATLSEDDEVLGLFALLVQKYKY